MEIRELSELDEFGDVVQLQREIWGFEEIELLPSRFFVVANKIGGQILGAYDHGKMVAFCFCIPGLKPYGKHYLHSHMLGVREGYRNVGLGRQLKLRQRDDALVHSVDLIEWTFDPLEVKNAFFNIERLGAVARRYVHNQYGTTSSPLHGGLPTDRLVAEWWIRSPRVETSVSGRSFVRPATVASISVPTEISEMRELEPVRAREIQAEVSDAFARHFRAGLAVVGFEKTESTGTYLLGEWESE